MIGKRTYDAVAETFERRSNGEFWAITVEETLARLQSREIARDAMYAYARAEVTVNRASRRDSESGDMVTLTYRDGSYTYVTVTRSK